MNKKQIIFLVVNVLLSYIIFCVLGWFLYIICHGNPTFVFPFRFLVISFFVINIFIVRGLLILVKLYSNYTFIAVIIEVAIIYLAFWILLG